MNIYVSVEIKTRQDTFRRVNTSLYDIVVDGGTWNPPAGVLLYPDNRAKAMSVWGLDGEDHRASGDIALSFASGVTQSASGTITMTIDYNDNQDSVVVEVPVGAGETLYGVATDIEEKINNGFNLAPYHSSAPYDDNMLTITSAVIGSEYNGTMTLDAGDTGVVGTTVDITGGDKEAYRLVKTVDLTASKTGNYAFALVDAIDMGSFESEQTIRLDGYNDRREVYGNRVKTSETNQPFVFKADKTYYPGKNTDDHVVNFAVNALPVSSGQFGQYPLFVMCKHSIWALEQGRDNLTAFERVSAYSLTHGVNSREASVNMNRSIAFISGSHIYLMSGGDIEDIGQPVEDLLGGDEQLAYYDHGNTSELWVISGDYILAYNLNYGRWYQFDRSLRETIASGGRLYSFLESGVLLDEYDTDESPMNVSVELRPVHYGAPDRMKHMTGVALRSQMQSLSEFSVRFEQSGKQATTQNKSLRLRGYPSDFSITIRIDGQMTPNREDYLHVIDSQFEIRYPDRTRYYQTTPQS